MKRYLKLPAIFFVLLCSIFSNFSFGSDSGTTGISGSPESVVSHFYSDYLTAWNDPDVERGIKKSQSAIDSFTTKYLQKLKDEDDSGADYFVDAQDICDEWKNNIYTKTVSVNSHTAMVNLTLGYGKGTSLYAITLVDNKGKWLMDSVKFTSRESTYCSR